MMKDNPMLDFLSHNEAPISDQQWDAIDQTVVEVARRQLVGRRFIPVYGPLGAGVQYVIQDRFEDPGLGAMDVLGEDATQLPVSPTQRQQVQIPLIYKDFILYWRDIESSRKFGLPLDLSPAAVAGSICARAEDEMIFRGYKEPASGQLLPGLLTVEGRQVLKKGDWETEGGVFHDVIKATEVLASSGYYAPYVLVVSPTLYSLIHRYVRNSGSMEIEHIRQIVSHGVYFSSVVPEGTMMVASTGMQNFDLAIAQDLKTAYLGAQNMNHPFRVFETAVLRIKRPGSICLLTA
jgi:uncharacterized linocin/CFP29 family protein